MFTKENFLSDCLSEFLLLCGDLLIIFMSVLIVVCAFFPGQIPAGSHLYLLICYGYLIILVLITQTASFRGCTLPVYLVLLLVSAGLYLLVCFLVHPVLFDFLICAAGILAAGIHGAYLAYHPADSNRLMGYLDALLFFLGFYCYSCYSQDLKTLQVILIPAVLTLTALLLLINRMRTSGQTVKTSSGKHSVLYIIPAVGICLLFTAFLSGLMSGQIHSVVDFFLYLAKMAVLLINRIMEILFYYPSRFLKWLISLLPDAVNESETTQAVLSETVQAEEELSKNVFPARFFYSFCGLFILGLAGYCLFRIRKIRFRKKVKGQKQHIRIVRTNHAAETAVSWFRRLKESVRFKAASIRYRKTPSGIYFQILRISGRKKLPYESPAGFIRRLISLSDLQEQESFMLSELADRLEKSLYSPSDSAMKKYVYSPQDYSILKNIIKTKLT